MFENALLNTINSTIHSSGGNTISDGKCTCTYEELPIIFETIDAFIADRGIIPGDCTAFRCGNTLPGAITLLWLLCRERDFVLLPRLTGKAQHELEDLNLPSFCKYKLPGPEPARQDAVSKIDLKYPASYLTLLPNSTYKGEGEKNVRQIDIPGKVFLKTSGSTSEPKLALHANENLTRNAQNCVERFRLFPQSRVLIAVPIYHMYGLGAGFRP